MTTLKLPTQKTQKTKQALTQSSRFGWMPFAIVGVILLNLVLTWQIQGEISSLRNNQPYIYLQKTDGTVDQGRPVNPRERTDEVVETFVEDWLTQAYTWNIQDPDLFVRSNGENFPLPLYVASFAIKPVYREAYLNSVAQKYQDKFPFQKYIAGVQQSKVLIFEQPIVEPKEAGIWDVTIIAYRTHSAGNDVIAQEKFNHVITVRAIRPSNQRFTLKKDSFLAQVMNQMQDRGLQIIQISQY